jgi:lauroyl/myristoyl acyltransferase
VRRESPGRFRIVLGTPIDAGDGSPAAQVQATQRTADELERLIRTDLAQWNCFKPLWPSAAEQRRLETLAAEMLTKHKSGTDS